MMKHNELENKLHLDLLSHNVDKGPFHFKDVLLRCPSSELFFKSYQPGYMEIIVDLRKTANEGYLVVECYRSYWEFDLFGGDIGLCKKFKKNLEKYVDKMLNVSPREKAELFRLSDGLIEMLYQYELEKSRS